VTTSWGKLKFSLEKNRICFEQRFITQREREIEREREEEKMFIVIL